MKNTLTKTWIDARNPMVNQRLWGFTLLERNLRELELLGISEAVVVILNADNPDKYFCHTLPKSINIVYEKANNSGSFESLRTTLSKSEDNILVLEGHSLHDRRVLKKLIDTKSSCAAISPNDSSQAGAAFLSNSDASLFEDLTTKKLSALIIEAVRNSKVKILELSNFDPYVASLRRKVEPYLILVENEDHLKEADHVLRQMSHKGVLEFVTQYIYAPFEFAGTRLLAHTPVTPNQITILWVILAGLNVAFSAAGYLLTGVLLAIAVGILDGIDGKIARLTLRFSKTGDLLDHVSGTLYDAFYYLALGWYFTQGDLNSTAARFTLVLFIAYIVERIVPGLFKKIHGKEIYDFTDLDIFMRLIGSRMDNNIWLMMIGIIFGWPIQAYYIISIWMLATAVWHTLRLFWVTWIVRYKKPGLAN